MSSAGLLRHILEAFFTCAQQNSCVFAELPGTQRLFKRLTESPRLFRKVHEKEVVENGAEFAAILDNYENEQYRREVLDRPCRWVNS